MKKVFALFLSVVAVVGFYGCKKPNPAPANSASVMFVNGCAGTTPGIDAKVQYANVSGAANMAFTSNSGYKYVKAGPAVSISYYITNSGTPVSSDTVSLANGVHYSAFSGGLVTSPAFLLATDDMSAPAASSAKIRFVNLSKDALNVTANAQTTVIDSNVTSLEITKFIQVTASNYELKAGNPTDLSTVVSTEPKTMTLGAGKIYTLMLTGTKAGTGASALKLTLINNN